MTIKKVVTISAACLLMLASLVLGALAADDTEEQEEALAQIESGLGEQQSYEDAPQGTSPSSKSNRKSKKNFIKTE